MINVFLKIIIIKDGDIAMNRKTSKNYIWMLIMVLFILVLGIAIYMLRYYVNSILVSEDTKAYDQYYVMIADDNKSAYWRAIYQSAYAKGQQSNVYVDLMGENLLKDYSKTELMEIAISSSVDGIIVSADDSDAMKELIDEAIDKGIMVVTVQNDNPNSKRCSFISVGSYNLGIEYGEQIIAIAKERMKMISDTEQGKKGFYDVSGYYVTGSKAVNVTVLVDATDSGQDLLRAAIQETVEKESNIKIDVTFSSVDSSNDFAEEETIRDLFMNTTTPDIIVCLSEQSTVCAYQTVVDYNKVGQTNILGYYVSDSILNAIDRGVVSATMAVDTQQLGGSCVDVLVEYSKLGNTSQYFTAGITVIDKGNVSAYMGGGEEDEQ